MMLFAVIDLFGFLTRPDPKPNKKDTKGNFRYLLSKSGYLPATYKTHWELILKIYRHGVMHQIFPKVSAIAKVGPASPLIDQQVGPYILNVDRLSADVIAAVKQIRQDLTNNSDPQLVVRMNKRLKALEQEDIKAVLTV